MKIQIVSMILMLFSILGFSQSSKDSLLQIFNNGEANAETLNLLAAEHYSTSIDSGKMFAQMALDYARVSENNAQIGEAFYQIGDAAYYSGNIDSCLLYYSKSLEYYLKTDKNNEIAGVYNDIGQVLQLMSYHDSATIYFDLALTYIDKDILPQGYYSILINKGTSFYSLGSYAQAIEVFLKIINDASDILPLESISTVYSNLGLAYKKSSNFEDAIKYYEKSYQIDDSLNLQYEKAIDLANIAGVYFSWKQYNLAQDYFYQSLEIYKSLKNKRGISSIYSNIAGAQRATNQIIAAKENYEKALAIALEINDNYQIASAYHGLGMIAFEEGLYSQSIKLEEKAKEYFQLTNRPFALCNVSLSLARSAMALQNFDKAKQELLQAEEYSTKTASLELKKEVALQYAQYFSLMGENKKSNDYYKSFIQFNDSLFNQKSHRLITEFNIKLNTLKQQRQIEKISLENKISETKISNRNRLIIILIGGLILLLIGSLIILRLYLQKQKSYQLLYEKSISDLKSSKNLTSCQKDIIKAEIKDDVLKGILERLHEKIEIEKVYLQMDLSIHKLAQQMDTNTSYLSKIINDYYQQNFNSFVNKYRILAAQEMMHQKKYRNYTIEAIAHECGFRSKSSFNKAFKQAIGLTPGIYIQKIKEDE